MNPKLNIFTFTYGDLSMDVNVSIEERNVYLNQKEIANLFEISIGTVSKCLKNMQIQMGQFSNLETFGKSVSGHTVLFYGLKIIKEIGQKYNPNRIQKLEEWLEHIIIENSQEAIDDNFEIVRYNQDNLNISVRYDKATNQPWLTQKEISILYGTTKQDVNYHINNILEDKELNKNSVVKDYLTTGIDGKTYEVMLYSYDMILAVGYRIRTSKAANFRNWASSIITKYTSQNALLADRGISYVDSNVIKQVEDNKNKIAELNEKVESLSPKYKIYYRNQSYSAYLFLSTIIATATREVFIIDPYADKYVLGLLDSIHDNRKVVIVLNKIENIKDEELEILKRSHKNLIIELIKNKDDHNRYIFIDGRYGVDLGESINTIGYYDIEIKMIDDNKFVKKMIDKYLIDN